MVGPVGMILTVQTPQALMAIWSNIQTQVAVDLVVWRQLARS
jgi:hypothetical protein